MAKTKKSELVEKEIEVKKTKTVEPIQSNLKVRIHSEPNTNTENVIGVIKPGSPIEVLGKKDLFYKVKINNKIGYAQEKYLKEC